MATLKQWEDLANEAIEDATYWKAEARKLQAQINETKRNVLAAAKFACPSQYGLFDAALTPIK